MLIVEHSVVAKAPADVIWKFYEQPALWMQWDESIESVNFGGLLTQGGRGTLNFKGKSKLVVAVTECVKPTSCVFEAHLIFAKLIFSYRLSQQAGQTTITHRVELNGLLAFLFSGSWKKLLQQTVPAALRKLVELAEKQVAEAKKKLEEQQKAEEAKQQEEEKARLEAQKAQEKPVKEEAAEDELEEAEAPEAKKKRRTAKKPTIKKTSEMRKKSTKTTSSKIKKETSSKKPSQAKAKREVKKK